MGQGHELPAQKQREKEQGQGERAGPGQLEKLGGRGSRLRGGGPAGGGGAFPACGVVPHAFLQSLTKWPGKALDVTVKQNVLVYAHADDTHTGGDLLET